MTALYITLGVLALAFLLCVGRLVREAMSAPEGEEIPGVGFVRTK
jgi:hypothetical protein